MVEGESFKGDDESSPAGTTPVGVPSDINAANHESEDQNSAEDVFSNALVKNLHEATTARNGDMVNTWLKALIGMKLHLPENSQLREVVSRTPIVEYLVTIIPITSLKVNTRTDASVALGHLVSGHHAKNIATAYKCGALEALMPMLGGYSEAMDTLSLLTLDEQSENSLLDTSSMQKVEQAMGAQPQRSNLQEWGCRTLRYFVRTWDTLKPAATTSATGAPPRPFGASLSMEQEKEPGSIEEAVVRTRVIGYVANALKNHKAHAGVNREAVGFIYALATKSPPSRTHLLNGGVVQMLGDILQRKNVRDRDIIEAAQEALSVVVAKV